MRSATQPLGSSQPLDRARLASRLGEVNAGFRLLAAGAGQLQKGLTEGAAKLRAAIWLEQKTGLSLTGAGKPRRSGCSQGRLVGRSRQCAGVAGLGAAAGLRCARSGRQGVPPTWSFPEIGTAFDAARRERGSKSASEEAKAEKPQEVLLRELSRAADGAAQIADGAAARQSRGRRDPQ